MPTFAEMNKRASELAARINSQEVLSEDELKELRTLTDAIKQYNSNAKLAAEAVAAATEGTAVSTEDKGAVRSDENEGFLVRAAKSLSEHVSKRMPAKPEIYSETRATSLSDLAILPTQKYVPVIDLPTPMTDIVTRETVSTNAVEFVTETYVFTTDVTDEGSALPQSTVTFTPVTASLTAIGHFYETTVQAAEDFVRLASIINDRIFRGIVNKVELAIASVVSAAPTSGAGAVRTNVGENTGSALDLLASIREGQSDSMAHGFMPNAVVLNPITRAKTDVAILRQTLNGANAQATLWDLKVVASAAIAQDVAYVGDFKTAVTVFDRGQISVGTTDSHGDNYTKGIITLKGTVRVLPYLIVPQAITKCSVAA